MSIKGKIAGWLVRRKILKASGLKGKERDMLKDILKAVFGGKNWVTTVIGLFAGIFGGTVQGYTDENQPYGINWAAVITVVIGYFWGLAQKSSNVTGVGPAARTESEIAAVSDK